MRPRQLSSHRISSSQSSQLLNRKTILMRNPIVKYFIQFILISLWARRGDVYVAVTWKA